MNVENHFYNAEAWLRLSRHTFNNLDYVSTLSALAKSYAEIREAMDHVLLMAHESAGVDVPNGD